MMMMTMIYKWVNDGSCILAPILFTSLQQARTISSKSTDAKL